MRQMFPEGAPVLCPEWQESRMGTLVEQTSGLTMERKGQDSYRGSSGLGPDMGLWNRAQMRKWAVGTADPGRTGRGLCV